MQHLFVFAMMLFGVPAFTRAEVKLKPEIVQRFSEAIFQCRSEFNITAENMANLYKTGLLLNDKDEIGQCFVNCALEKGELVKDDEFDAAKTKTFIHQYVWQLFGVKQPSQESVDITVDECSKQIENADSLCETSYKIWTCLYKALKNVQNDQQD